MGSCFLTLDLYWYTQRVGGVRRGSFAVYATKFVQWCSMTLLQDALVPSRYSVLILISRGTGYMVSLGGYMDDSKRRYVGW